MEDFHFTADHLRWEQEPVDEDRYAPRPAQPAEDLNGRYEWPVAQTRPRSTRRAVHGYVYELITGDPRDGAHPYVGMTETTIHNRVHGPNGHTSRQGVDEDPWKARILRGKAGYRCLERVYDTGRPDENDRALRRAEAFWIDRLRPTHNEVRPVRPPLHEPQPPRRMASARPAGAIRRRRMRRIPGRAITFLILVALFTTLAARLIVAMHLPWPAVPWVVSPALGVALAWRVFWYLHRSIRRLTGKRR